MPLQSRLKAHHAIQKLRTSTSTLQGQGRRGKRGPLETQIILYCILLLYCIILYNIYCILYTIYHILYTIYYKSHITFSGPRRVSFTPAFSSTIFVSSFALGVSTCAQDHTLRTRVPEYKASTQNQTYESSYGNPTYPRFGYFAASGTGSGSSARWSLHWPTPRIQAPREGGLGSSTASILGGTPLSFQYLDLLDALTTTQCHRGPRGRAFFRNRGSSAISRVVFA